LIDKPIFGKYLHDGCKSPMRYMGCKSMEHHWASGTQFDDVAFGQVMPGNQQAEIFGGDGSPIWGCVKTLYPCSSHQNSW